MYSIFQYRCAEKSTAELLSPHHSKCGVTSLVLGLSPKLSGMFHPYVAQFQHGPCTILGSADLLLPWIP